MPRLPSTGPSLSHYLRERRRAAERQAQTDPFSVPLAPGTIINEGWITPVLLNGWANYGFGYIEVGYCMTSDGAVKLRGFTAGGSSGVPVFTLPPTYATSATEVFAPQAGGNGTARVEVQTDGDVVVVSYNGTGDNTFLSLSGIRFSPLGA